MSDAVTEVVRRMVASATRDAATMQAGGRWVLLSLTAEIHRRAALEIKALADACQPPPSAPPRRRRH